MEEIYTNIYKESRKKAGLEQSEAADLIGVSYHSLAKYEKKINAVGVSRAISSSSFLFISSSGSASISL